MSWTPATADAAIADSGAVASIGQIDTVTRRHLDRRVRAGELIRYRGHWDTLSPDHGHGSLRTIWALPAASDDDLGDTIEGMMLRRQWDVDPRRVAA